MMSATLSGMLDFWACRWPERPAVKTPQAEASWGGLLRSAERLAAGLQALGIGKGDAVGILMHNRLEFIEALLAILKVGARVTLLNVRFTPSELNFPVTDAGIKAIFTEAALFERLEVARQQHPELILVLAGGEGGEAAMDTFGAEAPAFVPVAQDENDVALICYSSGTTGFPKGVMLTHRNVREGGLATAIPCGFTPDDRVLITAPLAYTWGMVQYLREALGTGATVTVIDPSASVDEVIDVLEGERITMWSGVPVLFERVAASPRFAKAGFPCLRHAVSGGASLHLMQQWQQKGVLLTQAYGLTETGGHVALLFGEDAQDRLGWAGRSLPGVDLAIADDEGRILSSGQEGEILVRGPMVMKGYLNNPVETAQAMFGDWLRTGDVGVIDAEGFLQVTGRKKDMLRSGGLNVYPAELERVLAGIHGIEELAVIGVKDAKWGEVPMIVVYGNAAPDLESLRKRCTRELAGYKRPRFLLDYGKPLPRTYSGKIQKQALREEFDTPPAHATRLSYES